METVYIFLIFAIGFIIAIGVGLEISKNIEETIISVLFWFLYIITIVTFINIILVGNYYLTMRNKTGPPGQQGKLGERGEKGEAGKCDTDCRDQYCYKRLLDPDNGIIPKKLRELNEGVSVNPNNIYIKSKVHQMCGSEEFKQLSPYNGPSNLVSYLEEIWKIWIENIYKSGGALYFQTIGSEEQYDWQADNPFDEIKKYDVFYWGMGRQYRPKIVDKCIASKDGVTADPNYNDTVNDMPPALWVAPTNLFDRIASNIATRIRVSFWRARQYTYKGQVFYPVGDIALGPNSEGVKSAKFIGNMTLAHSSDGPNRSTILVAGDIKGPINYEQVWESGNGWLGFTIWRPIAPAGYIALGDVATSGSSKPATGNSAPIRCVPYSMAIKLAANGNVLWNSYGIWQRSHANILGFIPNYGGWSYGTDGNAYNLFRCVVGYSTSIPDSDVNGSFYYIDPSKSLWIGNENDNGNPEHDNKSNRVGKGYVPQPKRDSKYSILAYLQLKNQPTLTHTQSTTQLKGQILDNAIGNTYTITMNNKCLSVVNGTVKTVPCDNENQSQYFSILMTGNLPNQCRIQHKGTGKYVKYKQGIFTLQDSTNPSDQEYLMFVMS
jgi:hypothetical protein